MGIPVVSMVYLGTVETLGQSYAIIVEEDAKKFARQTITLLGDENSRQVMGEAGVEYVKLRWSVTRTSEQILSLCEEIVSPRGEKVRFTLFRSSKWEQFKWHMWEIGLMYIFVGVFLLKEQVQIGFQRVFAFPDATR